MTSAAFSHGTIDNAIKQVVTVSLWTKSGYGVTTQLNLSAVLSRDAIYLAYSSTFYVYERYLMVLPVKISLFSRSICFSIVFYKITFEIKLEF